MTGISRYMAVLALALSPIAWARSQTRSATPGSVIEAGGSFLRQLQPRDSVLVADQLLYGFTLGEVVEGTLFGLPELPDLNGLFDGDTIAVVRDWQADTVKVSKQGGRRLYDIEVGLVIAPFEEGEFLLPRLSAQRILPNGQIDTLVFDPQVLTVAPMQIDTATFIPHDIKGQIRCPLTFRELLPYIGGGLLLVALVLLGVWLWRRRRAASQAGAEAAEPANIRALRKLDKWRGDKFWAPERQKAYYSGITDTLREYIAAVYGFDAMEMTTAEIFGELKGKGIDKPLYDEVDALFERADLVKFAKHTADEAENAAAVPTATRFVTTTYEAVMAERGHDAERLGANGVAQAGDKAGKPVAGASGSERERAVSKPTGGAE